MGKHIFRKVALDRLASPEQLDKLVTITTPLGWTSLLGIGLMLASLLVWSLYGSVPTVASGGGIIIKSGGVVSVVSPVSGLISEIYVEEGDSVAQGQIIGLMAQPKLMDEIRSSKSALVELENFERQVVAFGSENLQMTVKAIEIEKESLLEKVSVDLEQKKWLEEKIKIQEDLLEKGLIIREELVDTQTKLNEVNGKIGTNRGQIKNLEARLLEASNSNQQQLLMSQDAISEAKRQLSLLEAELEFSSRIISSYQGTVVEVRAFQGQAFNGGEPVLTLELSDSLSQQLQALIYMPPDQGKQIEVGMAARITPQTVKREEYGYMLGSVRKVAEFPSSSQGMLRVLKNDSLVTQFSQAGPPIAVFIDFIQDSQTPSGFKWSSSSGPDFKIDSGTLCGGSVEVLTQAPITLAIPYLKKKLGLD